MNNNSFSSLLNQLSVDFSQYRRSIFRCLIIGMTCSSSKKCVSAIWERFAPLFGGKGITQRRFYGFLNSSKLPWNKIRLSSIRTMGDDILTEGKLLLAADDTIYGKSGTKIEGAATHFDHAAKQNSSKYIWGHCRVATGILSMVKGRWAFLPLLQDNYISKKQLEKGKGQTKIELTVKHILQIADDFKNREILLTCDSWFGVKNLVKAVCDTSREHSINILSRLRINSSLCELPEGKSTGRGRPKVYGRKIESVSALAAVLKTSSKLAKIFMYSNTREVQYSETIVMSKALQRKIKIIFVYRKNGFVFPIFTTDLELSAEKAIEYYAARWKIEAGFKELKHELGALDNQSRKKNAVENHFNLACTAMTLVWTYAMKQDSAPDRRIQNSRHYSFADIRAQIEKELMAEATNFNKLCPNSIKQAGKYIFSKILARTA
ncbi:MAG: transposase [Simkaniaceae bacterium]|nr:transposase [Simkaniaceae bacterium]